MRGPRGYDAATKALGRKRVALAGADGTWLAVAVAPGSVQDRDCLGADRGQGSLAAALREAVPDGAFAAERCQAWCNHHGMRRRVVERGFGWLAHWGGLLRDRASRLDLSAARLACVAVLSGVEALVNPTPVHAKAR